MRGIKVDSHVKMIVYQNSRSPLGRYVQPPGTPVGTIEIQGPDMKHELTFVVSPYRKDLQTVKVQNTKKGKLSPYSQSLFDSCFKKWRDDNCSAKN